VPAPSVIVTPAKGLTGASEVVFVFVIVNLMDGVEVSVMKVSLIGPLEGRENPTGSTACRASRDEEKEPACVKTPRENTQGRRHDAREVGA
jgi:hypothetical protein